MNPEHEERESREVPEVNLRIAYSVAHDARTVQRTIDELDWLREEGYRFDLPADINTLLSEGKVPTSEEIIQAVNAEFDADAYQARAARLDEQWSEHKDNFLRSLSSLGIPLETEYQVLFTTYGTGGSYHRPNTIKANVGDRYMQDTLGTVFHEMIHLTIEDLIKENNIGHWTKERLVDLIYGKFYPERSELQRDPPQAEEVHRIFEQHYPDIKSTILVIAQLKPETSG